MPKNYAFNFWKVKGYIENETVAKLNTINVSKFDMCLLHFYNLNTRMRFKIRCLSLKLPECHVLAWGISVAGL